VLDIAGGGRVALGHGCVLLDGCRLHVRGATVTIGAGAVLGERCAVLAHDAVEIGERCVIGDGAVLVDFAHAYDDVERPVREQPLATAPVVVGAGARIGPGALLERGTRVPAGGAVDALQVVRA
jgi:acetyltransferase-like isoleucine patch superfamily enzyme